MLRGSAVHELDCKPLKMLEATSRSILISNLTGTFSKKRLISFQNVSLLLKHLKWMQGRVSLCCSTAFLHHSRSRTLVIVDSVFSEFWTGLVQIEETECCRTITSCSTCSLLLNNRKRGSCWIITHRQCLGLTYPIIGAWTCPSRAN